MSLTIGQLYRGTTPIICGGYGLDACHELKNGNWNPIASLSKMRGYATAALLSSTEDKEEDDLLLIVGGFNPIGPEFLPKAETFDGTSWSFGRFSEMPEALDRSCFGKINNTMWFHIGGSTVFFGDTRNTYFFNVVENKWLPGPELNVERNAHSCGLANWKNPNTGQVDRVVVVAGGNSLSLSLSSVELLYLNECETSDSGWVTGPSLPSKTSYAEMVSFRNTLVMIGGSDDREESNRFYQLSSPEGPWVSMNQTMKEERALHVAFFVPDELVNCHK